jgi:sn-glycerol 3-phosphate transport system substrate-binding protein
MNNNDSKNKRNTVSRRTLLKGLGFGLGAATLAACGAAATPAAVPAEKPAEAATEKPAEAAVEKPVEKPAEATAVPPTPPPAPTITPVPMVAQPAGSTKVTFWYGLGGNLGNVVRQVANKYNESQTKYYVEPVFQASYDDTINKINTALAGGELPHVAQVFDAGQQRMIDSKRIRIVQELLAADGMNDFMTDLEPAVRSYYTVGGTMYSMPFNSSTAMTYINKKMFRDAGLDADKAIWTYEELLEAFKKLTVVEGDQVKVAGLAFNASGWFFEQQHAVHEGMLAEPDNGRTARAEKYVFNGETGVKWLEFLKQTVADKSGVYYATGNPQAAFVSGQAAVHFDSIASLRGISSSAEKTGVEVGVAFMPRRAGAKTGRTIIGGASLYLTDAGTAEEQAGAWDFVKFATTTETQGFWSANTGYYPVRQSAYEMPDLKEALKKYPQFQVAIDQIRSAPESYFNSGVISGTFVPMRQEVQKSMDAFWSGKAATAQAALDETVARCNEQLEEYNSTVK